jgi:hypothetical protein
MEKLTVAKTIVIWGAGRIVRAYHRLPVEAQQAGDPGFR